jgi:hypothetical protein
MRVPLALAALVVTASVLAGCSSPPAASAEILVESKPPEEVRSSDALPALAEPEAKTRGHLAGVVVDEAIRPLEGALVRLPGLDLERTTDRDGSFGFVDLHPGPYFLTVELEGYYAAEAMLRVSTEEFTRAKVILAAVPPAEAYHVTQSFEGFTDLTGDPFTGAGGLVCRMCDFDLYIERNGLVGVVVEAAMQTHTEGDEFWHVFAPYDAAYEDRASDGYVTDPMRIEVRAPDLGDGDRFTLHAEPISFPAPEASQRFTVFVTAFYNEEPPLGWSFVAGHA